MGNIIINTSDISSLCNDEHVSLLMVAVLGYYIGLAISMLYDMSVSTSLDLFNVFLKLPLFSMVVTVSVSMIVGH